MSTKWSYSGDPASSQRDAVRFKLGDIVVGDPLLTDAEVDFCVSSEGSTNEAAIAGARAIIAKFSRQVSSTDDKVSRENQQKVEHFQALVKELLANRTKRVTGIFAGGISKATKETQDLDTDRVRPAFTRNIHDNPLKGAPISPADSAGES